MKTIDCKIASLEGYSLYLDKYHELSRRQYICVTDIYDEDVNFIVSLCPPYSYNYLEAGDVIRLTYKMKTGRNAKSGISNNYVYADEVVALRTASEQPWMSPAETAQTRRNDEEDEEKANEEGDKANEELKD